MKMPEEKYEPANETGPNMDPYPEPNWRMIGVAILIGIGLWVGIIWGAFTYGPSIIQTFQ
jgi:multisubunit Na+/H+ antiporter MnhB subunit